MSFKITTNYGRDDNLILGGIFSGTEPSTLSKRERLYRQDAWSFNDHRLFSKEEDEVPDLLYADIDTLQGQTLPLALQNIVLKKTSSR